MEFLKSIFADKALTYDELAALLKDNKEIKLANLASGQYVDKEKFDRAETQANDLQAQLTQRDADIADLKKLNPKDLQAQLDTLKGKYDTETQTLTQKLQAQTLNSKIDLALLGAKAKNTKAVRALLDAESIKLDGENVLGLTDQLTKIQTENPFLFGEDKPNPNPPAPVLGAPVIPAELNTDDMSKYIEARKKL